MSWYLFKEVPAISYRGIKVDGFQQMHRPKINLSWGINQKEIAYQKNIVPATVMKPQIEKKEQQNINNTKILTQTSDDEEQELMKLIKKKEQPKPNIDANINSTRNRTISLHKPQQNYNSNRQLQKNNEDSQFTKRIRYLQNSLLPNCRRDSMDAVLDYNLSKQVPLSQSRVSTKSNKKNQSTFEIGHGFNAFIPQQQPKKDLTKKLQDMYDYQDKYKKRVSQNSFILG